MILPRQVRFEDQRKFSVMFLRLSVISILCLNAFNAKADCLSEFNADMSGVYHHGPYHIDGHTVSDRGESHSEVNFIFPDRYSFKQYDSNNVLKFGAIDIENQSWRYSVEKGWQSFTGDDIYTLKSIIFRGSGNYALVTHVVCPDPVPNNVDNITNYQYVPPGFDRYGNSLVFIAFNRETNLPLRAYYSWTDGLKSVEATYLFRFDDTIRVDPPTIVSEMH